MKCGSAFIARTFMRGGSSYTYTHGGAHGVVSARPWMEPRWYGEGGEGGGEAAAGSGESEQSTP